MRRTWLRRVLRACCELLAACLLIWALRASSALADEEPVVYARVVTSQAALRTGPGATFRVVRVAEQGETFVVHERAARGAE